MAKRLSVLFGDERDQSRVSHAIKNHVPLSIMRVVRPPSTQAVVHALYVRNPRGHVFTSTTIQGGASKM